MSKLLPLFIIVLCFSMTHAQVTNFAELKSTEKLFVKHVDLRTQNQEIWEVERSQVNIPVFANTSGSEGAISNAYTIDKHLKSLDLPEIIEKNPVYPERTILFAHNTEKDIINPSVLIDPKHVLVGGAQYYELENTPGKLKFTSMDGYKILDDLGYAEATDIYLFGTDSNDYQNNMALVTLTRPLGAIIGWMGYGYTEDSYYNTNTLYVTALEPNDNNELTFHKHTANADMVLDKGIYFKPYKDLIPGAPYYNSSAACHGIISHWASVKVDDVVTMYDGATRITSEKYNTISSIIANDTPDQPDIMPLHLSVEPGIINASDPFNEFIFFLHNYSESAFSGEVGIDIYLSTDDVIDTNDTKLKTYSTGQVSMNALYSAHYMPSNKPTLPNDLAPGLYFLGAIINTDDANVGNNTTPPAECAAVLVLNPNSSNYLSGRIITSNDGPAEGYCMLFNHSEEHLNGVADITTVGADLNFEFENINDGSYIIAYIPQDSYDHRNIPTYYDNTPYWQNATIIEVSSSDTVRNIELNRIELPLLTGTKSISGLLSKEEAKSGSFVSEEFFDDVTLVLENKSDQIINSSCSPTSEGSYSFDNLIDGTYLISIDKPGFTQSAPKEISITNDLQSVDNINFGFYSDSTIVAESVTGTPWGIDENVSYSIYPNPVSSLLKVKTNMEITDKNASLVIYNSSGKVVSTNNVSYSGTTEIDTRFLSPGLYFLNLITNDKMLSKSFIKK